LDSTAQQPLVLICSKPRSGWQPLEHRDCEPFTAVPPS
jgi:hypothetical protein